MQHGSHNCGMARDVDQHISRRPNSANFQFHIRIPADLLAHYAGPKEVSKSHRMADKQQRLLDHFARIHRRAINRATEHLDVFDQPMPVVQKQYQEHFVGEPSELGAQDFDGRNICEALRSCLRYLRRRLSKAGSVSSRTSTTARLARVGDFARPCVMRDYPTASFAGFPMSPPPSLTFIPDAGHQPSLSIPLER